MTEKHLTDQRFSEFELADELLQGLSEAQFEFCTPIQAACLPAALSGKDIAGQAQTGTGKTAAFLLACCHHLLRNPAPEDRTKDQPRALILAPTRELAIQIHADAKVLAKYTGLTFGLIYGGTGYEQQRQILQSGNDILIGTPGRLIDYYKQNLFNLKRIQVVVLDEADRMFDLGFIKDLRFLLRRMPGAEDRLNLLFSATLSLRVMEMAYEHMNDPKEVKIEADTLVADQIQESCYYPANSEKLPLLINLLRTHPQERALIFVNTRHAAEVVSRTLAANDVENAALSGEVPQKKREKLLDSFKKGKVRALVATDVAARGLHIPEVKHVYNYDLPQDAEDYVHRIGRTARAGASGEATSFICEKYAYSIMDIETYIGHAIPRKEVMSELLEPIQIPREEDTRKKRHPAKNKKRAEERTRPERNKPTKADQSTSNPPDQKQPAWAGNSEVTTNTESREPLKPVPNTQRFSRKFGEVPFIG